MEARKFQPWSRGAVGLKPSSLTWSTGYPVSHVRVGVASCAGLGYCFITEDLFWGVIWAVGDPQEQERKSRMEKSRDMGPCPRSPHSLSLGWVPWAREMECGPQPYLTKLTMEQTDQSHVQPSRLLNTDTRKKHN